MTDILLVQPPIQDFYLTVKRTLPYGLAAIAASLRQKGFSVAICDGLATAKSRILAWPSYMNGLMPYYGRSDISPFGLFHQFRHYGYSLEHIAHQVRESGAFLIGISSLFTAYSDMALASAAAIRNVCPHVKIVLGGHHPTALPEAVMKHPAVDYVLRGDGEVGMPALAQALKRGEGLNKVPGLVWRRENGTLQVTSPAIAENFDQLPVPAFDLIRWRHYQRAGRGSLSITASRGCPMRCSYCAVNAAAHHVFRRRSVESVAAELKAAFACRSMGFIDFEDEHLCADKQWVKALMHFISNQFGSIRPQLRAMNGLYAPNLDEEILSAMQKAGFATLNMALITTSASQLKRFNRPNICKDLDRVLTLCPRFGLDAVTYIIVAGPGQDPYESVNDLLYLAQRRVLAGVSVFYPAPGSRDYEWCRSSGLLPPVYMQMRATALPIVHRADQSQTVTLLRLGRILNFIKRLLDAGEGLPAPAAVPRYFSPQLNRTIVGRQLLAAFFRDGAIYGVDHNGQCYNHQIDSQLVRQFLKGLGRIKLQGTK